MKNDVWLFSDLDGTLLPSDKRIPDDLRDGIQQFVQQGGHFTIATGRTIESARTYWEQLSVKALTDKYPDRRYTNLHQCHKDKRICSYQL